MVREFRVVTDRGPMRIAASSQEDAEQLVRNDGHEVINFELWKMHVGNWLFMANRNISDDYPNTDYQAMFDKGIDPLEAANKILGN